jgi:hypothetical protein
MENVIAYIHYLKYQAFTDLYKYYGELSEEQMDEIREDILRVGRKFANAVENQQDIAHFGHFGYRDRTVDLGEGFRQEMRIVVNNLFYDVEFKGFIEYPKYDENKHYKSLARKLKIMDVNE